MNNITLSLTNPKHPPAAANNRSVKSINQYQLSNPKKLKTAFNQNFNRPRNIAIIKHSNINRQFQSDVQKNQVSQRTKSKNNNSQTNNQYQMNMHKIHKLSSKLQELYEYYRKQQTENESKQSKINQLAQIHKENANITIEVQKIRNIINDLLLEREKYKISQQGL